MLRLGMSARLAQALEQVVVIDLSHPRNAVPHIASVHAMEPGLDALGIHLRSLSGLRDTVTLGMDGIDRYRTR
jgi:hypothetical protein